MSFDAHLDALKRKHLAMSDAVEQAQRSPSIEYEKREAAFERGNYPAFHLISLYV